MSLFPEIVEPDRVDAVLDDARRLQLRQRKATGYDLGIVRTFRNQFVLQILHHLLNAKYYHIVVLAYVVLPEIASKESGLLANSMAQCSQPGVVDQPRIQLHTVRLQALGMLGRR